MCGSGSSAAVDFKTQLQDSQNSTSKLKGKRPATRRAFLFLSPLRKTERTGMRGDNNSADRNSSTGWGRKRNTDDSRAGNTAPGNIRSGSACDNAARSVVRN